MANRDTQDRINALVTEEKLQNNIADALKKNLDLRTKEGKIARDLANDLQSQKGIEDKLEAVLQKKQELLEGQLDLTEDKAKKLLKELEYTEELLKLEGKRRDKQEEIKDLGKDFADSMLGSLGLSTAMFKNGIKFGLGMAVAQKAADMISSAFESTVGLAKDLYTQTGATAAESARLGANTMSAMLSMEGLLYGGEALAQAAKDASDYYGSTQVVTADMQKNITKLSAFGVEGAAQMNSIFESASGNAGDLTNEIQAMAQDAGVNGAEVFKEMEGSMISMVGKSKEELKYLAEKTIQLKKQGMTVSQMESMSENMLNVENSLRAQMKARVFGMEQMMGDTEKMREASMQIQFGDKAKGMEMMADAMKEAGLTSEKLNGMGTKQIGILADSYGMSAEQLTEMVTKQDQLDKIMKETGAKTTAEAIAIQEKQAANEAFMNSVQQGALSSIPLLAQMVAQYWMMNKLSKSVGASGGKGKGKTKDGNLGIVDAIGKIDMGKVLQGAAALVVVAAAVWVFGKAVQEFMNVSWEAVVYAIGAMFALVGALALVGMIASGPLGAGLLIGAAAMVVIAAAVYVLGKAIQEMAKGFGMMGAMTESLTALVMIAPGLMALAGIFGLLGVGLMAMSVGLAAVTLFLPTIMVLGLMLPLIASALGFGGGESESQSAGGGGGSSDALLEEIKGLRSDIQNQPVQIVIDDKVVSTINKKNSRMQGYRNQLK